MPGQPKTDFDRTTDDIGNLIALEHVNIRMPDLEVANTFFVQGLGLTRDPFITRRGPSPVWFNVGDQQFHVPLNGQRADVVRGTMVIMMPNIDSLEVRLGHVADHLAETTFSFRRVNDDVISVNGPWGNHFRCIRSTPGHMSLGLASVELTVPSGTAPGISRFYSDVMGAPTSLAEGRCEVVVGVGQTLVYVESDVVPEYDGHHIAVYAANFSRPHAWLHKNSLIVEESDEHQYRFNWIVDPENSEPMFELEHEVRSLHHPLYNRRLINRNPDQTVQDYIVGRDAF